MPDVSNQDFSDLLPPSDEAIAAEQKLQQEQAAFWNQFPESQRVQGQIARAGLGKTNAEHLGDAAKNLISGALTGVLDAGAFATDLVGARTISKGLARGSDWIEKASEAIGSDTEKAQTTWHESLQKQAKARANAQYQQDIANGMDPTYAAAKREATLAGDTLGNLWRTGDITKEVTQGLGSVGSDILLTGGTGWLAKTGLRGAKAIAEATGAKKYLAGIEKAANAISEGKFIKEGSVFSNVVKSKPAQYLGTKFKEDAGWATSVGLQEGGNNFRQQLLETLENTNWDNSPEYHARVAEKIEEYKAQYGTDPDEKTLTQIQEAVKEDIAFESAQEAGIKTGLTAAALSKLTKWEMQPFERTGKTAARLIGEAITEPLEEGITEGTGQFYQNQANKKYVDNTQDLYEDIGQSATTGAASGFGMTAVRGGPSAITETAKGLSKVAGFVGDHIGWGDNESSESISSNEFKFYAQKASKDLQKNANSFAENSPIRSAVKTINDISEQVANPSNLSQEEKKSLIETINKSLSDVDASSSVEGLDPKRETQAQEFKTTTKNILQKYKDSLIGASPVDTTTTVTVNESTHDTQAKKTPEALANPSISAEKLQRTKVNFTKAVGEEVLTPKTSNTLTSTKVAKKPLTGFNQDLLKYSQENPNQNIWSSGSFKDSQGNNHYIHVAGTEGNNHIYMDGKKIPLTPKEFDDLDFEKPETYEKFLGKGSFIESSPQSFWVVNSKSAKGNELVVQNGTYSFVGSDKLHKLSPEAQSILENPKATKQEKLEALKAEFSDNPQDIHINFSKDLTAKAQRTLNDEDATQEEQELAEQALNAMGKVVVRGADDRGFGDRIFIEDKATNESDKRVKAVFGNDFGKNLVVLKRPFYLLDDASPIKYLKTILKNPSKAFRANRNASAGNLIKKLFKGENFSTTHWAFDPADSLATQITTMLNPEAPKYKDMVETLREKVEASETLKKIICDENGKLKQQFEETMMIAAVNELANIVHRPRELNEEDMQRRDITAWCNESFAEKAAETGYLADEAMQGLQNSLKTFMGVAIDNKATINEVDKVFGEMASKILESMEDNEWISEKSLEYNILTYDEHGVELPYEHDKCYFFKASDRFNSLFKTKADILDAILNPNYRNTIWLTKPPVDEDMAHSDISVTDDKKAAIKAANEMPGRLNLPFIAFQHALQGIHAIPLIKGYDSSKFNKDFSIHKTWVSKEGQKLTRLVAYRTINEILALSDGKDPKDIRVYYDHSTIRNSRTMEKGPATNQGNKTMRQMLMFTNGDTMDLNDPESFKAWKLVLAQKLGESTNKDKYKDFEQNVQKFLDDIAKAPIDIKHQMRNIIDDNLIHPLVNDIINDKFGQEDKESEEEEQEDFWNGDLNEKEPPALITYLQDLGDKFPEYDFTSEEGQNAVLEAFRYTLASKDQKASFEPHVFLEVDGTNDGPSWANRLFGIVVGQFSPEFIRNNIKTGFFPLMDAVNQDKVLNYLNDTEDKSSGIHEDVSKNKFPARLKEAVDSVREKRGNKHLGIKPEEYEGYLACTTAILKLFKIVGMLEGDVDAFMRGNGSITFTKGISKNAVTVVNYGAQVAGLVAQTINMLLEGKYGSKGLYERLNDILQELPMDDNIPKADKIAHYHKLNDQYQEILKQFKVLFSYQASREYPNYNSGSASKGFFQYRYKIERIADPSTIQLKGLINGAVDVLPGTDFRISAANMSKEAAQELKEKFGGGIKDFLVTDKGLKQLTSLCSVIFGEDLHGSVTDAIGRDALSATKIPQTVGSVLNGMAMEIEASLYHMLNKRGNITPNDQYWIRKKIKNVMALFTFQSGAKIFSERRAFRSSQKPLYEGRTKATSFYPSRARMTDIGVAAGALVTQGIGDSATMDRIQRVCAEEGISFEAVFDGAYISPTLREKLEGIANEAVMYASRQKPVEVIYKRLLSACDYIRKDKDLSKLLGDVGKNPEDVMGTVIGRLCAQEYLDGTPMTEQDKKIYGQRNGNEVQSLQYQFTRSFHQFLYPEETAKRPFGFNKKRVQNKKTNSADIREKFHDLSADLLGRLKQHVVAEKVKHTVLDDLPQSFHHMAGSETNFIQGNPGDAEKLKSVMNEVNADLKDNKYKSAEDFLAAYLAYRANTWANKNLSKEDLELWKKESSQDDPLNAPGIRTMSKASADIVERAYNIKEPEGKKVEPYVYQGRKVPLGVIRQAFKRLGKKHGADAIYSNIYNKLKSLVPENTEVHFYPDKKSLPKEVQNLFRTDGQNGVYFKKNGIGQIYVISQDPRNKWDDPKNLEVLMHEGIHAAISSTIQLWAESPNKVLPAQKQALDNLYSLCTDFGSLYYAGRNKPEIIQRFQDFLKDAQAEETTDAKKKAAIVDEALAYILSNEELFSALGTAKFKQAAAEKHRAGLNELLYQLYQAAKKVWATILTIVTGSPLDKLMSKDSSFTGKDSLKNQELAREFLYNYGVNTLALFNDVKYIKDNGKGPNQPPKKSRKLADDFDSEDLDIESDGNPLVRASRSLGGASVPFERLGFRGYLHKRDPFESLRSRKMTKLFKEHLANNPMGTFKGALGRLDKTIKNIKVEASKWAVEEKAKLNAYASQQAGALDGLVANPEEVAKLATILQEEGFLQPTDKRNISYLYKKLQEKIADPYCFVDENATQEEKANSVRLYNLLKGNDPAVKPTAVSVTPESLDKSLRDPALFMAIASLDPVVNKFIGSISEQIAKQESSRQKGTFGRILADTFNGILNKLSNEQIKSPSLNEYTNALQEDYAKRGIDIDVLHDKRGFITKALDYVDYTVSTLPLFIASLFPSNKLGSDDRKSVFQFLKNFPTLRHDFLVEVMRGFANRHIPVQFMDFARDLYGRTPSNSEAQRMLKEAKGFNDKSRHETLTSFAQDLLKAFGVKKMRDADRAFYHRMLGMHLSQLNLKDLKDLVHDKYLLESRMKDLQKTIIDRLPQGKRQVQKVKQLARYLWGDGATGVNLLMNPDAISELLNEQDIDTHENVLQQTQDISTLLTYYGLHMMEEGDLKKLQDTYTKNQEAFENLVNCIKSIEEDEQTRTEHYKDKSSVAIATYNRRFGWLPRGNRAKGEFRYISAKDVAEFKHLGWEVLEDPVPDPYHILNEPVYRAWNTWVETKTRQEGIFQQTKQTLWGWDVDDNKQIDSVGTRIVDPETIKKIQRLEASGVRNTGFIPIFDEQGGVFGYEIATSKADRALYIESKNDPFSGIAQWVARQERETIAGPINDKAIDYLVKRYNNASSKDKDKEFIDVFHTDNVHIRKAIRNMNSRTYKKICRAFGGDHCYIEKDEVYTFIGYVKPSLIDMWQNEFILPKKIEDAIVKCLETLFGKNVRKWIIRTEAIVSGAASWARETIIIRSGFVPVRNAIGNLVLLESALRIPPKQLYNLMVQSLKDTEVYNTLRQKELDLQVKQKTLDIHDPRRKEITKQIKDIKTQYESLRVYPLIKMGEYSTIDMEGTTYDAIEIQKNKVAEFLDGIISRVPEKLQATAKNIAMTKESDTFQAMAKLTNYGDWIAKCIAYRYLTEESESNPIALEETAAINVASTLFVDYDQFVGPERDWLNRVGITWFTTFKYRMITAALLGMSLHPGSMVLGTIFDRTLDLAGTPLTDNAITKLLTGGALNSLGWGTIFRSISMHPAIALMMAI